MARGSTKKFTRSYPKPVYRRPVRLRTKVKTARTRQAGTFLVWVTLLALIGGGCWWGYREIQSFLGSSESFKIHTIEIRGCKNVALSEISVLLPFRKGDNLWSLRPGEAEKNIQACKPELKTIDISRGWKKVTVIVAEREPAGFVVVNGEKLGIDNDNVPFPLRGAWITARLPEIDALAEGDRREILNFMSGFSPADGKFFSGISRFALEPVNSIIFDIKGGPRIYWGRFEAAKLKAKLNRLTQVLIDASARYSGGLSYVNLSYFDDGRVIVMPALQNKR
jgi:cell division septal protein FtsQ